MIAKLVRLVMLGALAGGLLATGGAARAESAEPPYTVAAAKLAASLSCHGDLAAREPVLLVPGTTLTPDADFSWNYERAFTAQGRPWCTVTLPDYGMDDIQVAAEYVVNAIRTMYAAAGGRIQIVGHSQGGMIPRWALKFWPGTRAMVDDVIGLAPSNHGTADSQALCAVPVPTCSAAFWQQASDSHFIHALNDGPETWAGVSYTNVYSYTDEVVTPNFPPAASSDLTTGAGRIANVPVQQVCPLDLADHLSVGTTDNVAYALTIDALDHDGPADPARIAAGVCLQPLQPGVDPAALASNLAWLGSTIASAVAGSPKVSAEPALASYVTGAPSPAAAPVVGMQTGGPVGLLSPPTLAAAHHHRKHHHRKHHAKKHHRHHH